MKILKTNELSTASTLTMTDVDSDYPVTNLYDIMKERKAQATGATSTISATWDSVIDVNSLFIGYHNVISLTLKLYDSGATLLHTEVLTVPRENESVFFDMVESVKSATITIVAVQPVFVGNIAIGESREFQTSLSPVSRPDTSTGEQSPMGQLVAWRGVKLKAFSFTAAKMDLEDYEWLESILKYDIIWVSMTDNRKPVYGFFSEDSEDLEKVRDQDYYEMACSFLEAR